jgi:hypothetical protein
MASTYSPTLRVELIGSGDQSGTWGETTNSNLGTIIETAITGVQPITFADANYTLTAFNGLPDEARNAVLVLGGTNTAQRNLIAPAAEKTYVVKNGTGANISITTNGAGANVVVQNGETKQVFCDGTNFYESIVVAGTGTGSIVYSNSPTLTGIPAAPTANAGTSTTQIATTQFVTTALQAAYPVGSVYMNASNETNPGTLLGFGTWTSFGAGRMPVGFNAADPLFDTAEETGGSKDAIVVSHTHTATSAVTDAGHRHFTSIDGLAGTGAGFQSQIGRTTYSSVTGGFESAYMRGLPDSTQANAGRTSTSATGITVATTNNSTGSSGTNANLPPYITVYMWKRTA